MKTRDLLLAYGEWLDGQHLVVSDQGDDKRTHDELARAFIEQWQGQPLTGNH